MSSIVESLCVEPKNLAGNGNGSAPGELSKPSARCFGARHERFLDSTFPGLFAAQVARGAERVAVVSGNERLTYAQLNARANQLARHLRAMGAGPESLVAICIDRSLDMAVGILGILKSGAGYLPIDPEYPAERLRWLLEDSQVSLIVAKAQLANQLPTSAARKVLLDSDQALIAQQSDANLDTTPSPGDLAYVIYTSGSTGEPKGVMLTHGNLGNYLLALQNELDIDHNDIYLHTASIAFSSSRRQLLLPLSQGASVVIASSEERKDPLALFAMIKRAGVSVMDAVPSFWRNCTAVLSATDQESRRRLLDNRLRLMLSASEPLLSDIPQTWMHQFGHRARHVHMFGQTETAGIVCVYDVPATEQNEISVVPVGRPIANTEIFILDEALQPVAVGAPGELYIGGAGVGRGYLNRPELTAAKFIAHPFSDRPDARLYRTGDFARWSADGTIEFVGRQDSQVKIRGFRVELGEVEAVLAEHSTVRESIVVARDDKSGAKRLIAYFVASTGSANVTELRAFLNSRLPDYMVPSTFVQLQSLPLTANGKINRRALPEPEETRPELVTAYEAPQTLTEKLLADIWDEVLQVAQVGIDDDFFDLGGHSLLAIQAVARINQRFKITLPLRILFDGPTIRNLSAQVDSAVDNHETAAQAIQRSSEKGAAPLSFAQQRLWFLDQLEPGSPLYNINRALRLHGPLDVARLESAVQLVAVRHEALRTTFVATDGLPFQLISASVRIPCELHDLRFVTAGTREAELQRLIEIATEEPFDLARGPLVRLSVFRLTDEEHVLLVSSHHIIGDAWTVNLFLKELEAFYKNPNDPEGMAELPVQYVDFTRWQRARLDDGDLESQLAYWKQQLTGAPSSLDFPTDHERPATPSSRGAKRTKTLTETLSQSLKDVARQEGVTPFMLLLAAFQTLLNLYSGQEDILVGTPVAGRTLVETEALLGCFVNTLVLRGDLSGDPTLREVIKRTRETALGAYSHQEIPFEKLVEELRPKRNLNRSPLFQVMFVVEDETKPQLSLPGIHVDGMPVATATSKFDFSLGVIEKPNGFDVWLSYSTELFEVASINAMLDDYELLLELIVANPAQRLSAIPALSWKPRVWSVEGTASDSQLLGDHEGSQISTVPREFVTPRTPIEERLAGIWSEVLKVEKVSAYDNFFELGGHSLLAAQVISRARNTFSTELTLRRLFETPTVAGLAEAIYQMQTAATEDHELAAMLADLSELSEEEAQQRIAEAF